MDETTHDVLIVGGGLVGASLACALHGSGLNVALAEASAGQAQQAPSFDERNLALARASRNALTALGVWKHVASRPSPIERIHISSRGDFGAVRLTASDYGLDAFGAVVVARELGAALEARLAELASLVRYRPARVTGLEQGQDRVRVSMQTARGEERIATRLIVAADGTESAVRTQLGIGVERHDYAQTLFVATVQPERAHAQVAYERFTENGPVALLPLAGGVTDAAPSATRVPDALRHSPHPCGSHHMGSICTVPASQADAIAALDDESYREFLQQRFGWRLGRLRRVGKRSAYALQRVCANALTAERAVVVGNAAQTLHPIGAQGFNLGLRDALTLAEELSSAQRDGRDPGAATGLERYARRRKVDRDATLEFSDGLVRLFSNRFRPLRALRSLGLLALDRVPGLSDDLVTGAMGFRGDVPALARDDAA